MGASITQVFLAREDVRVLRELSLYLTLVRTPSHTPTVVQGGVRGLMDPPPWIYDILQYFNTIISLWSSLQDEVYFMGGGAAEGQKSEN